MDPLNFAGLLGGNVMQQFSVQLRLRESDRAFRLGMPAMETQTDRRRDAGRQPSTSTLEGGGLGRFEDEVAHHSRRRASR